MKRIGCLLIALMMLAFCAAPVLAEETGEVDALLEQIANLLDARESLRSAQSEMLAAIEAFEERCDYSSLVAARIACNDAMWALNLMATPEFTMTDAQMLALMARGVETDAVEMEYMVTANSLTSLRIDATLFKTLLYTSVCTRSKAETLSEWVSINREILALENEYDMTMVNYILLPVADEPGVMALWESALERWPLIGSQQSAWETDSALLEARTVEILDSYEAQVGRSAAAYGRDSYYAESILQALELMDEETLSAEANPIDGMPLMVLLPLDGWMYAGDTILLPTYEGAEEGVPSRLTMIAAQVSVEEFNDYVDLLVEFGLEEQLRQGSDEEGWQVAMTAAGRLMVMSWSPEGIVMIIYDPSVLTLEYPLFIQCQS